MCTLCVQPDGSCITSYERVVVPVIKVQTSGCVDSDDRPSFTRGLYNLIHFVQYHLDLIPILITDPFPLHPLCLGCQLDSR